MHRRHVHALLLLLLLSLALGAWNAVLIARDIRSALWVFGFATGNTSNATSTGIGQICLGGARPVVTDVPDQTATAGELFQYTVNATQSNGHAINYTTNSTLFTINPDSGLISFTPSSAQVGFHPILVTARDKQNCASLAEANDTFTLNITGNVTTNVTHPQPPGQHPPPHPPPRPVVVPLIPQVFVQSPYFVLDIRRIVVNGDVVSDPYYGIPLTVYPAPPNRILTIQVTVRNIGFNQLSNVRLELLIPEHAQLLGVNPAVVPQFDPNAELTFTAQVETGAKPFDIAFTAIADQDRDTEVLHVTIGPALEKPQFGFEIPPWLPLLLAIPLLFFLGYSITKNTQLIRDTLQNIITALGAFLYRRTYLCDEDMLRKLIKANKLNRFLRYWVAPDVYARYHAQYKNLRMRQLERKDFDRIAVLIRQHVIAGEMATLIVLTEGKPHPRIMTAFAPSKTLAADQKRITFSDPLQGKVAASEERKVAKSGNAAGKS